MRHVAAEEEQRAGKNSRMMVNVQIPSEIMRQMIGIQQDILRAPGGMKNRSEIIAEDEGETVTPRRVESESDEGRREQTPLRKQQLEDVGDLEVEELEEVDMECM